MSEDNKSAEELKELANECYKNQEYEKAIELYSEAIKLNDKNAIYYANRSIAYLRTECFGYALQDATKAIELDRNYVKGYYRRAAANMAMGKFKLALKDFEFVVKMNPNNSDAKRKFNECQKIVKMLAFQRAIAVDDKKSVADQIDIEGITIDDDYSGPCLVDGNVTKEFINQLLETFKQRGKLHRKFAYKILVDVRETFKKTKTLVDIEIKENQKFTVCGDIHGQFYDLLNIFELNGLPSHENPYLFNGDFVDRGSFSVECILTLFSFKLLFPEHFYMSRGNHESQTMNQVYGFEGEVKSKYSSQMYELFAEVFNLLPLAHCLNQRVLIMHGGLFSQDGVTLEMIRNYDRNRQPPDEGIMCDLLWSDPWNGHGRLPSKRGIGIQFGQDVTELFLKQNNLEYIIRSHEVKDEGYEVAHNGKCITVFSAPNYCDTMGNKGAFIVLNGSDLQPKFVTYAAVPHPQVKPMAYANSLFSLFG